MNAISCPCCTLIGPGRWEPKPEALAAPFYVPPEAMEAARRLAEQLQKLALAESEGAPLKQMWASRTW